MPCIFFTRAQLCAGPLLRSGFPVLLISMLAQFRYKKNYGHCARSDKKTGSEESVDIIRRDGFDFGFDPSACKDCPGLCCYGDSGNIWVDQQEILQICSLLQINPVDFIRIYLNRIGNRFSIKEVITVSGFECIFFKGPRKKCSIYTVRPFQCRQYPFWGHFKKHKEQVIRECPGIIVKKDKV